MRPSLIIIGAMKAGTTALFQMLSSHPRVLPPVRKELHFFNRTREYERGMDHYLVQFPRRPFSPRRYVTFEASPSYLPNPVAAERIASDLPSVLLVAILRDPVDRAYSAWNMYHRLVDEPRGNMVPDPRSFMQAVEDEWNGVQALLQHRYLFMSDYALQLPAWLERFPRERLMVFGYKQFKERPAEVVNAVCVRWGIDPLPQDASVFGVKANVKPYRSTLDPAFRERMYDYFEPRVHVLKELLGEDLDILER